MDHWHKFARVRGIWAILVALLCFSTAWATDITVRYYFVPDRFMAFSMYWVFIYDNATDQQVGRWDADEVNVWKANQSRTIDDDYKIGFTPNKNVIVAPTSDFNSTFFASAFKTNETTDFTVTVGKSGYYLKSITFKKGEEEVAFQEFAPNQTRGIVTIDGVKLFNRIVVELTTDRYYSVTSGSNLSAITSPSRTYNNTDYYIPGSTINVEPSNASHIVESVSGVEGATIIGTKRSFYFTMPNNDVEVSAVTTEVHTVGVPEGLVISDAYTTIGSTKYYKTGETYTLSVSNANDIIDEIIGVEAEILNDRKSARFTMPSNDVKISAAISEVHTVSVPEGLAINDAYRTIGTKKYYKTGETYTLSVTNVNEVILEITGVEAEIPSDRGSARFTMPSNDVEISVTFSKKWGEAVDDKIAEGTAGHYYVNMPCTGTNTLTLRHAVVTTFKVYDDGGSAGMYSDKCDGTLVLTAPTGYALHLSGNITTERITDRLTVYDGSTTDDTKLLDQISSPNSGDQIGITYVASSGQNMTLFFHSDVTYSYAGLDLTVTVFEPNEEFDFAMNSVTGGSVVASIGGIPATKAKANDVVTLTASPSTGYRLSGISVLDANGHAVDVTWDGWSSSATFIMPASAVSVTPTFTNNLTADGDLYVKMPTTGSKTINIPAGVQSFKVYDDGGSTGNYSNNCDGSLVLTAPTGYVLQLSGNITTEYSYDYMHVYDDSTTGDTKLLDKIYSPGYGTQTDITTFASTGQIVSTGQNMTLFFHSNYSHNYAGLDLTVTVFEPIEERDITVNSVTGGSVVASIGESPATKAKYNDVVTLTALPSTGYVLSDISVVDANNNAVDVEWDVWSNSATFIMPASAVTIASTFTNNLTADDGLYINMPTTGSKTVSIPAGVQSFKVYDDGGSTGNYSNNCDGSLVLTAPTGYVLQLSGDITTERISDRLTVYDGSLTTDDKLLDKIYSPESGTQTAIATVASTGQSMTLNFYSGDIDNYAGLDLTVTLISSSLEYDISVNTTTDGSVVASIGGTPATKAKVNDQVTLTASPSTDYLLSNLSVVDANNNAVEVTWNVLFKSATFTMPASAVSVTPTFTNNPTADGGLYINMPKTGSKTINIPAGVQSFKVYDDGGSTGYYSYNCDGALVLTAPTGYVLHLSGNITTEFYDYIYVYDGSLTTDDKLLDKIYSPESGTQTAIATVVSTGQSMRLDFISNSYTNYAGLDLTVTVFEPNEEFDFAMNSVTGGSVVASIGESPATKAKYNDVVTLTASPSTGYVLSDISVVDANNNAVEVTWNVLSKSATFAMPPSAVTIASTFTNNLTADDGLYINMPTTGSKTVSIPAGVQSFKVYDDGGSTGNYSYNCDGALVLTAPTGYVLQLSGYITTQYSYAQYSYDYMHVYDGSTTADNKLLDKISSPESGTQTDITTVVSSGQSMRLDFHSDGSKNYAGLDLTVTVFEPNEEFDFAMNSVTGGSVVASIGESPATKAKYNDVVTLTASPSTGYVLSDISVVDANNNAVEVTWNVLSKSATFAMPPSAVTVTPTFTNNLTADGGLYVNMPKTGSKTVTIPAGVRSFKVYDDGGSTGNYSYNCDGALVLTAPAGYVLQLSGNITTESISDRLTVYDGSTTGDKILLYRVTSPRNSIQTAITTVTSTGQSMRLDFHSDSRYNYAGLDLAVTVFEPNEEFDFAMNSVTGGSVVASIGESPATKAKYNDVVTLTASPSTGYVLSGISVLDANGRAVDVTLDLWSNSATFTMPASAVTVSPTFTNNLTADDGLYINMPTTGAKTVAIPAGVTSFKVYDDGGSTGNYSDNCNGTLVLTAPMGYVLQLSGNITTERTRDYMHVYDGSTTDDTKLLDKMYSPSSGTQTDITTVGSSGQNMTLFFHSDSRYNYAGLDLTVTVVAPNAEYGISVNSATGGSVVASIGESPATKARFKDVVTLTASPSTGYLLRDLGVVDANGNAVDVEWDVWSNSATFIMPASAVTIASTFTNSLTANDGLYIDMPKTGSKTVSIPSGVTSFKVYDDGGSAGMYSDKCDGTLVLTAPTGYVLQLSGYITTESISDRLAVYDGSTTDDTKLFDKMYSPSSGTQTDITTVGSTGQSMTLNFLSDSRYNYAGLDLTVTLISSSLEYDISVNTTTDGSVVASIGGTPATKAKVNDVVALTASPSTGYLLSGISVQDANGRAVDVEWDVWSNSATFIMPASAVTIASTFTNQKKHYINMPTTGTKTVTIPSGVTSFKVYDDGGSAGMYSDKCDGTLVLTAPTGYALHLSGNITTERIYDRLTVYDGSTTDDTKLLDKMYSPESGTQTAIATVVSSGQSMRLDFHSDGSDNYAGLDLTVTVFPNKELDFAMNSVTGGSVVASIGGTPATKAKFSDVVTLTASPSTGYVLSDISVVDANNNAVDVTWDVWSNSATFTMPASAVTIASTFTNNLTADDGLYVNMPHTGSKTVSIPAGVRSFKVYDDGGSTGNYSYGCDGSLVLTAPTGYALHLSGNITTDEYWDKLTVYDGSLTDDKLLDGVYSSEYGIQTAVTTVTSSGQNMTLFFHSNYSHNYAGLDLTVTVFDPHEEFDITVNSVTGGSVDASVGGTPATKAKVNDVVTLTASPSTGNLLSGISVVDANGHAVEETWDVWSNSATFTFTMPASAVTVTPTFTNSLTADDGLYIDMPKTGSKTVAIPAGIQSFKVYDDGGSTGNYSNNCDGTLVLTAPTGYVLQLSGNITTERTRDYMHVYDGSTTDDNKLFGGSSPHDGTQIDITTVGSSGQNMTLFFHSDIYYQYDGLDLTVTVVDPNAEYGISVNSATGGSVVASIGESPATKAKFKDVVTLTASPSTGYLLRDLGVVDANGNAVDVEWDVFSNSATFTMLAPAVRVTPTFTNSLTANDGLYIDMPKMGSKTVSIPSGVTSFKVYDDGGSTGDYSSDCDGTLVLTAPPGHALQLSGNIMTERIFDGLIVYDGSSTDKTKLFGGSSPNDGTQIDITTVVSSGQNMTLLFGSNSSGQYAGLDLTVTVVPIEFSISYNGVDGATFESTNPVTYTIASENITLTNPTREGYSFAGWTGTDLDAATTNVTIAQGSTGDRSYTATWKKLLSHTDITVADFPDQSYTGSEICSDIEISVKDGEKVLVQHTDYEAACSDNIKTGTASMTISGKGDYAGEINTSFEIVAKQTDYAAVQIFEDQNGKHVEIDAEYSGKEPVSVPDAVAVDFVEIKRNLLPLTPATIVLPVQLPEGTTFNARFYYLKEVKQVGCSWNAVMKYIGSNNLPEPNTPYAVILNDGEDKLEFDLHGEQATVRTAKIADNWDLSNKWQFVGTYSYKVWEEGNDEIGLVYGFAGSNEDGIARGEFGRVMAGAYAVPMRSYLKKRDKDVRVTGCAQGIRANGAAYSAVFSNTDIIGVEFIDEEEQTTAIGRMNTRTGEFKIDRWYDLKGRKVDNVNRDTKGAYYGKKVFKK